MYIQHGNRELLTLHPVKKIAVFVIFDNSQLNPFFSHLPDKVGYLGYLALFYPWRQFDFQGGICYFLKLSSQ